MRHLLIPMLIVLTACFLVACGSDSDDTPDYASMSDQTLLDNGWNKFENGNYRGALPYLQELTDRDSTNYEAYCALAWTLACDCQIEAAMQAFNQGLEYAPETDSLYIDLSAGLAFALNAHGDYQASIDAIQLDFTDWTFDHNNRLGESDVWILIAEDDYCLGEFSAALIAVQRVEPGFLVDVNTVEGRAALAAKIESLADDWQ